MAPECWSMNMLILTRVFIVGVYLNHQNHLNSQIFILLSYPFVLMVKKKNHLICRIKKIKKKKEKKIIIKNKWWSLECF